MVLPLGGSARSTRRTGRELLGVQLTPTRDGRDARRFIRRVLQACTNEHADGGGRWGPVAFVGAQQDGSAVGTDDVREAERGGAVEWFSVFKQRVKRFYRRWLHNARVETAVSRCEAFVALYNLRRA
jgi:transposase-like protein